MYCSCVFFCGTPKVWFVEPYGSATTCVEILRGPALFGEVQGIGAAGVNAPGSGHRHVSRAAGQRPHARRRSSIRFGFENVRSTVDLAAPWFIGAALGLQVVGTFSVGQRSFMVGGVYVKLGSELDGMRMADLSTQTRVIAITRPGKPVLLHPRRDTRLRATDTAYLVGRYRELLDTLGKGQSASRTSAEGSGRRTP